MLPTSIAAKQFGVELDAINSPFCVAVLSSDGLLLTANQRFGELLGYASENLIGSHHSVLVDTDTAACAAYANLWKRLARGEHQGGIFKYKHYNQNALWLHVSYRPVPDASGQTFKVIMHAINATEHSRQQLEFQTHIAALSQSHVVVLFDMLGNVLSANDVFLDAMGYAAHEVEGRHHRMFVEASVSRSTDYVLLWRELSKGMHQTGQYRRLGKDGREVWLQASYSPVLDLAGRPVKVVKHATVMNDVKRPQAEYQQQIEALHSAQCVVTFAANGTIIDANDNFSALTGYQLNEICGKHHRSLVPEADAESEAYEVFWQTLRSGTKQSGEYKRVCKDGRELWLKATYVPVVDPSGRPPKIIKFATDVTLSKLREAEYAGQITAIQRSHGVIHLDMDGLIIDANEKILSSLGYVLQDLQGQHYDILIRKEDIYSDEYQQLWKALRAGQFVTRRYRRLTKSDGEIWLESSYNPILDLNGKPYKVVEFATDITADILLTRAYEDAQRQASIDAATNLPNRNSLTSYLTATLANSAAPVALLYIDVDRFKIINDTYGHHAGDRVLSEVADRLRRSLQPDWLAARIGGDEFVIVAPGASKGQLDSYCQEILALASTPIQHDLNELQIGLSIGIAMSPEDANAPDDLMRCADIALYRVKAAGRANYCFYTRDMNDQRALDSRLINDLQAGLQRGEFYLEYQPRFVTRTQEICRAEALVRWLHPERGVIGPTDFIPLAEKTSFIVELGDWVLSTACHDAANWNGLGVSVNVSPVQFQSDKLVETVERALTRSGLLPELLELEITEGVLLDSTGRTHDTLQKLKTLGVKLAIDDFGAGYSSLNYLRLYPFDTIKIDRQFIADMHEQKGSRAIVQAILALGKALHTSVTAEGVENIGQLATLILDQCAEVQGYLLAPPMLVRDLEALLKQPKDTISVAFQAQKLNATS